MLKSQIDKAGMRRAFNDAAHSYADWAKLQRKTGEQLLDLLSEVKLHPARVLDVGAGPGFFSKHLQKQYPAAQYIALDIAEAMLHTAAKSPSQRHATFICNDMETLALANDSVDVIFSNMVLHWSTQLTQTFNELMRVLKPNGILAFATLGIHTLRELRQSWEHVDHFNHVNAFIDANQFSEFISNSPHDVYTFTTQIHCLYYPSVFELMHDLKNIGAHNTTYGKPPGLMGKNHFQQFIHAYEHFRNSNGLLPATYEVIYGVVRKR